MRSMAHPMGGLGMTLEAPDCCIGLFPSLDDPRLPVLMIMSTAWPGDLIMIINID